MICGETTQEEILSMSDVTCNGRDESRLPREPGVSGSWPSSVGAPWTDQEPDLIRGGTWVRVWFIEGCGFLRDMLSWEGRRGGRTGPQEELGQTAAPAASAWSYGSSDALSPHLHVT